MRVDLGRDVLRRHVQLGLRIQPVFLHRLQHGDAEGPRATGRLVQFCEAVVLRLPGHGLDLHLSRELATS